MLPDAAKRVVEEVGSDTTSGAMPLAQRALNAYASLDGLREAEAAALQLHSLLRQAQPCMAAVTNVSLLGSQIVASGRWDDLGRLKQRLSRARQEVARQAATILRESKVLLTISHSSDVFEALKVRSEESGGLKVYACESRPLLEGVALARALRDVGIHAVVVADAAAPGLVPQCDGVLVGTDSLLRDGHLVNKIGTLPLALACKEFEVPFYPLLEVLKLELEGHEIGWEEETRDPGELNSEVEALNFYFERLPGGLARSLVTDAGIMDAETLIGRIKTIDDLMGIYLPTD